MHKILQYFTPDWDAKSQIFIKIKFNFEMRFSLFFWWNVKLANVDITAINSVFVVVTQNYSHIQHREFNINQDGIDREVHLDRVNSIFTEFERKPVACCQPTSG